MLDTGLCEERQERGANGRKGLALGEVDWAGGGEKGM